MFGAVRGDNGLDGSGREDQVAKPVVFEDRHLVGAWRWFGRPSPPASSPNQPPARLSEKPLKRERIGHVRWGRVAGNLCAKALKIFGLAKANLATTVKVVNIQVRHQRSS